MAHLEGWLSMTLELLFWSDALLPELGLVHQASLKLEYLSTLTETSMLWTTGLMAHLEISTSAYMLMQTESSTLITAFSVDKLSVKKLVPEEKLSSSVPGEMVLKLELLGSPAHHSCEFQ